MSFFIDDCICKDVQGIITLTKDGKLQIVHIIVLKPLTITSKTKFQKYLKSITGFLFVLLGDLISTLTSLRINNVKYIYMFKDCPCVKPACVV